MSVSRVFDQVKALLADETGAAAIEYALIAAGISVLIAGIVYQLGGKVQGQYEAVDSTLK